MRDLKISVGILLSIYIFLSCNKSDYSNNESLKSSKYSKLEIVSLDSLIKDSLYKDSIEDIPYVFDSQLNTREDLFLDTNYKLDFHQKLIGKWLIEKSINNNEIKRVEKKVFVIYNEDSSFSMKSINISGKWWVSDSLLIQKFESSKNFYLDTSIIHIINDTLLEVLETKKSNKFIFKKLTK